MSTIDVTYTAPVPNAPTLPLESLLNDLYDLRSAGAALNGVATQQGTFSGTDDTARLQALVNAQGVWENAPLGLSVDWDGGDTTNTNNMAQGTASFPRGAIFVVNGTITIPPGVTIEGNDAIVLQMSQAAVPTFSVAVAPVNPTSPIDGATLPFTAISRNQIKNLTIWGGPAKVNANRNGLASGQLGTAILMRGAQGFRLDRCLIGGFRVGIDLQSCQYSTIRDCEVEGNVHNIITRNVPKYGGYCIDLTIDGNSRFAKSAGGYGLWLQSITNVTIGQTDANFCGHAALVVGGPLPDYIARTIPVVSGGAGYPPNTTQPLTITTPNQTQITGIALINSSGAVSAAYTTDGLGNATGVGTTTPKATVNASSTTAAVLAPYVQQDSVTFADLFSIPSGGSLSSGLINMNNFKAEVASPGTENALGNTAPDCGSVIFIGAGSAVEMEHVKISAYGRGNGSNWYRLATVAGGARIQFDEWHDEFSTTPNPAVPTDFGAIRSATTPTTTALVHVQLPQNSTLTNFQDIIINGAGNPATGGEQNFLELVSGDERVMSHGVFRNCAYFANLRLEVQNSTGGTVMSVDGNGNTIIAGNTTLQTGVYLPDTTGKLYLVQVNQAGNGLTITAK